MWLYSRSVDDVFLAFFVSLWDFNKWDNMAVSLHKQQTAMHWHTF